MSYSIYIYIYKYTENCRQGNRWDRAIKAPSCEISDDSFLVREMASCFLFWITVYVSVDFFTQPAQDDPGNLDTRGTGLGQPPGGTGPVADGEEAFQPGLQFSA